MINICCRYYTHTLLFVGLINSFTIWKWSSYGRIILDKPSKFKKQEVLDWFGDKEAYKEFHLKDQGFEYNEKYILENE